MKSTICILAFCTISLMSVAQGKSYQANNPGMWSSNSVWAEEVPGYHIGENDTVFLNRNVILDEPLSLDGVVVVGSGVTIYSSSMIEVLENGRLINKGSLMVTELVNHGTVHNHHSLKALESMTGAGTYLDGKGQPLIGMAD